MTTVQTSEFTVLASRYRKGVDGKIIAFLQVQSHPDAPLGYVRCTVTEPPLAGTRLRAKGAVITTDKGPVMQVSKEADLTALSGQQGTLLHMATRALLDRFNVKYNTKMLEKACLSTTKHLCTLDKSSFVQILTDGGVPNAFAIVEERDDVFATVFTKTLFQGLETIKLPFDIDAKRDLPFLKGTWPKDVMDGCMPNYIESTHGQKGHSCLAGEKPFYLVDHVKYDGVDNFYRALAIASDHAGIFPAWLKENLRPATLTQCYINDKQKQGTQIFTASDMKQLERLGLNQPAKIAARLGNMVQLPSRNGESQMIPQGVYQSSSRIAELTKLTTIPSPLKVELVDAGLDTFQTAALTSFCEGAPLTLISGPPGTGKSTLISRMIEHAQRANEKVVVVTPTGKSSSRLNQSFEAQLPEKNRPHSSTAHALFYSGATARKINKGAPSVNTAVLKDALDSSATDAFPVSVDKIMRFSTYKDGKNDAAKPELSFYNDMSPPELLRGATVFIDESTQITGDMAALILEMRPKRLIMTGDLSQLKPVGAGKPFHDLITLAQEKHFGNRVNFVELQIDHRATKELSDFTKKLRAGEIPLEYVEPYAGDAESMATELLRKEAAVVECASLTQASELVERIVSQTLQEQNAVYHISHKDDTSTHTNGIQIKLPMHIASELSAKTIVCPSIMTMAYTNVEVSRLNQQLAAILRPMMSVGAGLANVPALSMLTANGIKLGDTILQTENAKQMLRYSTPQGNQMSASTMNGEAYILIGANVWLPLPETVPKTDIQVKINNAWQESGCLDDALDVIATTKRDDPNSHYSLLTLLLEKISTQNSTGALNLVQMTLGEILLVEQARIQNMQAPTVEEALDMKDIKRLVLPPALPRQKDTALKNDSGVLGLAHHIWKIDVGHVGAKLGMMDQLESSEYTYAYEKSVAGIISFTLGNAYTVHKAQGSQAKIAISVVSPPMREDEATNHEASVYTATTRAEQASYILTHGVTAHQLNNSWKATRVLESAQLSAVTAIARGDIPYMPDSLTFTTAIPPQRRNEGLRLNSDPSSTTAEAFRHKVALASIGLPSYLDIHNASKAMKAKLADIQSNHGLNYQGIAVTANSIGETTHFNHGSHLARKKEYVWEPGQSLAAKATTLAMNDGKMINSEISSLFEDFCF